MQMYMGQIFIPANNIHLHTQTALSKRIPHKRLGKCKQYYIAPSTLRQIAGQTTLTNSGMRKPDHGAYSRKEYNRQRYKKSEKLGNAKQERLVATTWTAT
jgi:hypothetical protein